MIALITRACTDDINTFPNVCWPIYRCLKIIQKWLSLRKICYVLLNVHNVFTVKIQNDFSCSSQLSPILPFFSPEINRIESKN